LVLCPLNHPIIGWIDYVFAKSYNNKLLLRAFTGSNRVEESSQAFFELDEYLQELEQKQNQK